MDKKEDFPIYFIKKTQLDRCPFLVSWVSKKLVELGKLPKKPDRHGVPKGEKMPLPRDKCLLALYKTVDPRLNLKKFSDLCEASYGTVKIWTSADENFTEYRDALEDEFVRLYLRKFKQLVEDRAKNPRLEDYKKIPIDDYGLKEYGGEISASKGFAEMDPLNRFLYELSNYRNASLMVKINRGVTTASIDNFFVYEYREAYMFFKKALLRNPQSGLKLKDYKQIMEGYYEREIITYEYIFDLLNSCIKENRRKEALAVADHLKFYFTKDLMPHHNELVLEYLINNFQKKR
jgi:hypothetical protein